jgi:phosphate transport system substrate-binding protein
MLVGVVHSLRGANAIVTTATLRSSIMRTLLLASLPILLCSMGCQRGVAGAPITVDGSSTLYPLTSAVAADFKTGNPNASVTVKFSGTDAGFALFCKGGSDIQDASRAIEPSEIAACRDAKVHFIELPVAYDGLTVIVNPANTWAEAMTVRELKALWEPAAAAKIAKWSQVRQGWPEEPIKLFGPGPESGTFDFFTQAIVGTERQSRTDYTSSADDEAIVKAVASDRDAIGYVGYSYLERHRDMIKAVKIDDLDDSVGPGPIEPSPDTVRRGLYRPLTRPLFVYVNTDRMTRPEVKAFVDFYMKQSPALAGKYEIPLNPGLYSVVQDREIKRVEGSVYEKSGAANQTLDELMNQ